jgi:hypothetical protein
MSDKRAVEISMNVIIVAIICLLVLIVLAIIFTGQTGKFMRGINDCAKKGGEDCEKTDAECVDKGGVPSGPCIFYDSDGKPDISRDDQVCCVYK